MLAVMLPASGSSSLVHEKALLIMLLAPCCCNAITQLPDVSSFTVKRTSRNARTLPEPCPQHDVVLLPLEETPAGTESPVLIRNIII